MGMRRTNFHKFRSTAEAKKQAFKDITESEVKNYIPDQPRILDAAAAFAGMIIYF